MAAKVMGKTCHEGQENIFAIFIQKLVAIEFREMQ